MLLACVSLALRRLERHGNSTPAEALACTTNSDTLCESVLDQKHQQWAANRNTLYCQCDSVTRDMMNHGTSSSSTSCYHTHARKLSCSVLCTYRTRSSTTHGNYACRISRELPRVWGFRIFANSMHQASTSDAREFALAARTPCSVLVSFRKRKRPYLTVDVAVALLN